MSATNWFATHRDWRGKALDILVFIATYFIYEPITRALQKLGQGFNANDDKAARQLAWLLLAGFVAYMLGAWLKRARLQERLARQPKAPEFAGCAVLMWVTFHFTLTILAFVFIATGIAADSDNQLLVIGLLIASLFPTIVAGVAALKQPPGGLAAWRSHWLTELAADLLLAFFIVLASVVWSIWIAGIFTANTHKLDWGTKIFGLGMMLLAFTMFYLTPRFIYLVEDYRSRVTWLFILLAVSPSVLRNFLGQLPLANWLDWFV